ncbi:T9SS type A sorting domain-containing protein [Fluviicola sp.]|uniref:T9SS type A sorting domain-containing protein n=1 Tax=Fluviicola sp. TaxID=1917219 RepID=UPI0031E32314
MRKLVTLTALGMLVLAAKAQIPNNGFEILNADNNVSQWSKAFLTVIWIDSTGESHGDSIVFDSPNNALYLPSTDAHSGQYALEMRNALNLTSGIGITGGAILHSEDTYAIGFELPVPVSPMIPESFSFYYKYFPLATDSAYAIAKMFDVDGFQIGEASITLGGTVSNYTFASAPIVYTDLRPVEYISINFATATPESQPTFGTRFLVDDVSFDGTLGLDEPENALSIYPNPSATEFSIDGMQEDYEVKLFSLSGESLELTVSADGKINCSNWPDGVYLLHISTGTGTSVKKLMVSH